MKKIIIILSLLSLWLFASGSAYAGENEAEDGEAFTAETSSFDSELNTRFEEDQLILEETETAGLAVTADAFELSEECLQVLADLYDGLSADDFNDELEEMLNSEDRDVQPVSLSPAGNSGFVTIYDTLCAYYDGQYRIVYPSMTRGVEDVYDHLKLWYERFAYHTSRFIGSEGVVYSPDGRYAAILNVRLAVVNALYYLDPIIIDLSTGEMILTATYADKLKEEDAGVFTTAAFSSDGRYFYYMLYGAFNTSKSRLCRYDLTSGETQICKTFEDNKEEGLEHNLYYPYLSELSDGSFMILNDGYKQSQTIGIARLSQQDEEWTADIQEHALPIKAFYPSRLDYSADSGYAVMTGRTMTGMQQFSIAFQAILPEEDYRGIEQYICIETDTNEAMLLSAEEYLELMVQLPSDRPAAAVEEAAEEDDEDAEEAVEEDSEGTEEEDSETSPILDFPCQVILNSVLSPDGQYLLLYTKNHIAYPMNHKLLLVRLSDLTVRQIQGIDAEEIGAALGNELYMEWNTDQLIIRMQDGVHSYQFK